MTAGGNREGRRPPVVVVTGPTSAGKTRTAIHLAREFDAEIVNADSMQVYRGMDIGTAKPTAEEQAQAPHHLLDVADPGFPYSAGRYVQDARAAAAAIHGRDQPVILAGGTGLYIRAFLEGLVETGGADPSLRARLEEEHRSALEAGDPDRLHARLAALDPDSARAIHPRDVTRIVRALELAERGGAPASEQRRAHGFRDCPYRVLHLALDPGRDALGARIDAHCRRMLEMGLLQEVRELLAQGYGFALRPMQAIGYRHMQPVVAGSATLEGALEVMQRDTRRYARRQRTWLRSVPDVLWFSPDAGSEIEERVARFLAEPGTR
ncbi:MAG: tRNA (adenosine(37)-N6)-dimethylallyltransferase MiaA [Myxococcota bacterium]|nr:tRNA (adenosine(37)-N6)-dimethylallyltransferase MiaA [Myxococcota bacterium]